MAFLSKGKKVDLLILADEMNLVVPPNAKIIQIKDLITNSESYEEEFCRNLLQNIIEERVEKEKSEKLSREKEEEHERIAREKAEEQERLFKEKQLEQNFELEKIRLQLEAQKFIQPSVGISTSCPVNLQLKKLMPEFNPKEDDMALFLNLFQRQLTFLQVEKDKWVAYLLGVLPNEIAQLIAREAEDKAQDFDYIKEMLLERFKISAEKFRQLFATHKKSPEKSWKDFHFELRSYFEGWLCESNVQDFESLKNLILLDQMKKRVPPDVRDHFLDVWSTWLTPEDLINKLDTYDSLRRSKKEVMVNEADAHKKYPLRRNHYFPEKQFRSRNYQPSYEQKFEAQVPSKCFNQFDRCPGLPNQNSSHIDRIQRKTGDKTEDNRQSFSCFGCGTPNVIKSRCKTCNPQNRKGNTSPSNINKIDLSFYSFSTERQPASFIEILICNKKAAVCADSGATHSVAGEKLYHLLKDNGLVFESKTIDMTLADGITAKTEILTTLVNISVQGKIIPTEMIVLKHARGNRTLLGLDFLSAAGIVLDFRKRQWSFSDYPQKKYKFIEPPSNLNALLTVESSRHLCELRDNEGPHLSQQQRKQLNDLLVKYEKCFRPGGEPTPFIEHRINTGDHLPVSVPPYRMTPAKKDLLKKEIDKLLAEGIIEEAESPYASPVVLIPKPNGTIRLCVDYRKLNSITVSDSYPLPRMDDLLHEAKPTPFMTTIDLKSGYHQVKVHPDDQDKTAFVCPFGTFRYLRMPFGLKNAPATFQRLIDRFRNGLDNVLSLAFLDDIIILSETFEQHLIDLKAVFERLVLFKLHANRGKCNFACSRVKYLGFWITQNGIEVDPEKISSIQKIPPPINVKQVQSFLQTCSWFRRYIQNFAEISRPLSELTKKKSPWKWGFNQQHAFETLKKCLITPPVLKQADSTKPYIIRTDASNYALEPSNPSTTHQKHAAPSSDLINCLDQLT